MLEHKSPFLSCYVPQDECKFLHLSSSFSNNTLLTYMNNKIHRQWVNMNYFHPHTICRSSASMIFIEKIPLIFLFDAFPYVHVFIYFENTISFWTEEKKILKKFWRWIEKLCCWSKKKTSNKIDDVQHMNQKKKKNIKNLIGIYNNEYSKSRKKS